MDSPTSNQAKLISHKCMASIFGLQFIPDVIKKITKNNHHKPSVTAFLKRVDIYLLFFSEKNSHTTPTYQGVVLKDMAILYLNISIVYSSPILYIQTPLSIHYFGKYKSRCMFVWPSFSLSEDNL